MSGLRPFFLYFGGKYRAAPHYPEPRHDRIVEPFAGAAGYSVRHPDANVELYDLDENIVGTWDYLIRTPSDEIASLPVIGEFETVDELDVPQGAKWLIGWWLNPANARPCKTPGKWARENYTTKPGSFWTAVTRDRIAGAVESIRHWTITRASFEDVLNVDATWFVDPPYQTAGKDYRYGSRSIDFEKLGAWCESRRGQVIVCENEGAEWLPFRAFRSIKGTPGRARTGVSREVIWTNDQAVTRVEEMDA